MTSALNPLRGYVYLSTEAITLTGRNINTQSARALHGYAFILLPHHTISPQHDACVCVCVCGMCVVCVCVYISTLIHLLPPSSTSSTSSHPHPPPPTLIHLIHLLHPHPPPPTLIHLLPTRLRERKRTRQGNRTVYTYTYNFIKFLTSLCLFLPVQNAALQVREDQSRQ